LKKSGEFRREQKVSNPGRKIPVNGLTSPKGQGNPDIVDHFVDLIGSRCLWAGHLKVVDECDYYVLVIGARYGSTDAAGSHMPSERL
jgi:hypothetical protein